MPSPRSTTNRQGDSLPWSGARAARVRMSFSSASLGPGARKVMAEADRRRARNASTSGTGFTGRASPNVGAVGTETAKAAFPNKDCASRIV